MKDINDAGFNGAVDCGGYEIKFRRGYDIVSLRNHISYQPYNQFFWLRNTKTLMYRNKNGEFFKMNFEKIEL